MKRLIDIILSGIGIIVLSPILILTAVLIKLDSKGPVLYRQTRVGRYNKDFRICKFRSMYTDADKRGLLTLGDRDPRVTRVGVVIRKWKIDELPQLFNVLSGEMSFVGPRPEVRKYVDCYTSDQLHVLDVRPGITCYDSIKYRDETEILAQQSDPDDYYIKVIMQDKIRLNLEYVAKHNLLTDMKILFSTFLAIIH